MVGKTVIFHNAHTAGSPIHYPGKYSPYGEYYVLHYTAYNRREALKKCVKFIKTKIYEKCLHGGIFGMPMMLLCCVLFRIGLWVLWVVILFVFTHSYFIFNFLINATLITFTRMIIFCYSLFISSFTFATLFHLKLLILLSLSIHSFYIISFSITNLVSIHLLFHSTFSIPLAIHSFNIQFLSLILSLLALLPFKFIQCFSSYSIFQFDVHYFTHYSTPSYSYFLIHVFILKQAFLQSIFFHSLTQKLSLTVAKKE